MNDGQGLLLTLCYVTCYLALLIDMINKYAKKTYLTTVLLQVIKIGFFINSYYTFFQDGKLNNLLGILLCLYILTKSYK